MIFYAQTSLIAFFLAALLMASSAHAQSVAQKMPEHCVGRQPAGMVMADTCLNNAPLVDCSTYSPLFGGRGFPGDIAGKEVFQPRDTYFALQFDTNQLAFNAGTLDFASPQFGARFSGPRIVTISQCPGDFHQTMIEAEMGEGCYKRTDLMLGDLKWARKGETGAGCKLPGNGVFYYNILYTTQSGGTPPEQLRWQCGNHPSAANCYNNVSPLFR